ncbi:MAG: hypothetical protein R2851_16910 [Caldilineaceae bacterium]
MTEVTLISPSDRPLQPLIEAALMNEVRLLEAGKRQTEQRLRDFEAQFDMVTADFVRRYAADEIEETLETIEWLGEYRLAQTIQEKLDTLKGIRFAH